MFFSYRSRAILFLSIFISLGLIIGQAEAQQIQICGKYQRADGSYSHGYKLTASWVKGSELNRVVGSRKFIEISNYLIIQWDDGGFTMFENLYDLAKPTHYEKDYVDQRGVAWKIQEGWGRCN